ncbi:MAG TPA: S9 family peptidase [Nitriliruptorales bacterium]|nr:S9 family peptidase [Nitriliruptorales bacterium]
MSEGVRERGRGRGPRSGSDTGSEHGPGFDLDRFLALPRLSGLTLSLDGERLVVSVAEPSEDGTRFVSALWEVDPSGERPARRLTRPGRGEAQAAFLPDGSLLFTSARPDADGDQNDEEPRHALWRLPGAVGEARLLTAPPAGVDALRAAKDVSTAVLAVAVYPGAAGWEEDRARAQGRDDAGVGALLFADYPIRFWDRFLEPRQRHLWYAAIDGEQPARPRDVTPDAGGALYDASFDVTPDGRHVVTGWWRNVGPLPARRFDLALIDLATGDRTVLLADDHHYHDVACAPDSRRVACVRTFPGRPDRALEVTLVVAELDGSGAQEVAGDFDLWPRDPVWSPDGAAVFFCADERGHRPIFRVDLDGSAGRGGRITRLTADGAYHDVRVAPDGTRLYALRSDLRRPPHPVVLHPSGVEQDPMELPSPAEGLRGPGTVERRTATAADGSAVSSWLVLPADASARDPVPLVVFIHGGPLSSWNDWHWRWNPHVLAAEGYAVLLPDPALSTGYGQAFVQRGWGAWGGAPYTDLMAAVDDVAAHPAVDGGRLAAMGASFGGYMANWIAGHTGRFRAIVTHAGIWDLHAFHGTGDLAAVWGEHEFGDPYRDPAPYEANSPSRHIGSVRTPVLVIHGEGDFRVPVSEALRLWTDLRRHDVDARFLYFPDEHHWVLVPNNARLWYRTVLAFLDHHVRGREWVRPDLL